MPKPQFAKLLRASQTDAEQRLWYRLRAYRFMGLKFKRQKQIGPFIADFVCMELKLVIEADGGQHGDASDVARDAWFERSGYTLLRFWNNEVLAQTDAVLERVRDVVLELGHMDAPALSPSPSPASGRGEQTGRASEHARSISSASPTLPSPARGRGVGGEGGRSPKPAASESPGDASQRLMRKRP
ncbi:endonuclease domain-containing protein [Cupriavidus sp. PET2-C1]